MIYSIYSTQQSDMFCIFFLRFLSTRSCMHVCQSLVCFRSWLIWPIWPNQHVKMKITRMLLWLESCFYWSFLMQRYLLSDTLINKWYVLILLSKWVHFLRAQVHDKDLAKELYKKYSAVRFAFFSFVFLHWFEKPLLTVTSGFSLTDP